MPREKFGPDHTYLAKQEILSYEEMTRVVQSLLPLGLKKVRITGGEPLLRKDIAVFVTMLRTRISRKISCAFFRSCYGVEIRSKKHVVQIQSFYEVRT